MLFKTPDEFVRAPRHAVTVFGMSGVGKTRLAALLRESQWFHYSVDYRIGTRHMGEMILDNYKAEAMKVPFLRDLLKNDSIRITSNIRFSNLEPLAAYLGLPGDPERGGLPFTEYQRRQAQHATGERLALQEIPYFVDRAHELYGYTNFVADTGGSLIEVIDHTSARDPVLKVLTESTALLYIRGTEKDAAELVKRFRQAPKPMYYRPEFLEAKWAEFKKLKGIKKDESVDPMEFGAWGFEALLHDRLPRYQALADKFGYTVEAADVAIVRDGDEFLDLMANAIRARMRSG